MVIIRAITFGIAWGLLLVSLTAGPFLQHKRKAFSAADPLADIKTSMVAWWDCTDASNLQNKHNSGTHDLSESGTVGYTSGYADFDSTTNTGQLIDSGASLSGSWLNSDAAGSFAARFRVNTGWNNGHYLFRCHASARTIFEPNISTSPSKFELVDIVNTFDTTSHLTEDTWYTVVANYDGAGNLEVFLNASSEGTDAGTYLNGAGGFIANVASCDADIDWMACWNRELTAAEITALHNAGSTLTYPDLP